MKKNNQKVGTLLLMLYFAIVIGLAVLITL